MTWTQEQIEDLEANLEAFTGSDDWHTWSHDNSRLVYTDGIKYLAEKAGAFWLIDLIASYQGEKRITNDRMLRDWQLWELKVNADHTAVATCRADSDREPVITQQIEYTDFPLPYIKLYVESSGESYRVVLLPSEH